MGQPELEIGLLRMFVAVAETGSFTGAGNVVGRSQSAVSQRIAKLEESLGRSVFLRTSRSLALTQLGERLLIHARYMIKLSEAIVQECREPPPNCMLRVGLVEDFLWLLPHQLSRFRKACPDVHIELTIGQSNDLYMAFEERRVDCILAKRESPARGGRLICCEPRVWVAADGHVVDFNEPIPLVLPRHDSSDRSAMIATLDAARQRWRGACSVSSMSGLQAAVAAGLGITLLGRSFVQSDMQILDVPRHWPQPPLIEVLLLRCDARPSNLSETFAHFLTESLHQLA